LNPAPAATVVGAGAFAAGASSSLSLASTISIRLNPPAGEELLFAFAFGAAALAFPCNVASSSFAALYCSLPAEKRFSTSDTSASPPSTSPSSFLACARRYNAFTFSAFCDSAALQSSDASCHLDTFSSANARFEYNVERPSRSRPTRSQLSMQLVKHSMDSSNFFAANARFPFVFISSKAARLLSRCEVEDPFAAPDDAEVVGDAAVTGDAAFAGDDDWAGEDFAGGASSSLSLASTISILLNPAPAAAFAGDDDFAFAGEVVCAGGASSSLSLASTICILLNPAVVASSTGEAVFAGEAFVTGGASSSLSLASTICILVNPGAAASVLGVLLDFALSVSWSCLAALCCSLPSVKRCTTSDTSANPPSISPNSFRA